MKGMRWIVVCLLMASSLSVINYAHSGEDFVSRDIQFKKISRRHAKVSGKLTNNSGKFLPQAEFMLHAYDEAGNLIKSAAFNIRNFATGSTREFNTSIETDARKIASHKIELKQKQVTLIKTATGFVLKDINFIKSSTTYTKVQGGLVNNSGKDLRQADFVIQVYDAAGNLKNNAPFSIRNFIKDTTRSFNATLQANIKDIRRYEIELKAAREIPPSPTEY